MRDTMKIILSNQSEKPILVVGLFNRDDSSRSYSLPLSTFGIDGEWKVRDLWAHADEGSVSELKATVPAHGCKIVKLTK